MNNECETIEVAENVKIQINKMDESNSIESKMEKMSPINSERNNESFDHLKQENQVNHSDGLSEDSRVTYTINKEIHN